MKKNLKKILILVGITSPSYAFAETWTPMIAATMFDGIRSDMVLLVGGMITLFLIVLGVGMLWRAAGH